MPAEIRVKGAREHNLRDVSLVLPRNQLICFTGVSGSGKSSLSFDTLYAEGQRRYVESLSSYARHFMGQLPKPDVDQITGLSPSISISQKSTGHNPRSTVGTITEIYDFLRVLYARVGTAHCPDCRCAITAQTREQIVGRILQLSTEVPLAILAPLARNQKGEFRELFEDLRRQGYGRGRVDGRMMRLAEPPTLDRLRKHNVEVVIDRFTTEARQRGRVADAVDQALKAGSGNVLVLEARPGSDGTDENGWNDARELLLSSQYACPQCGRGFPAPSPQLFSFNSPQGMCTNCDGIGHLRTFVPELLIPNPKLSLKQGAVVLLGKWSEMPTFTKHSLQSVADSLETWLKIEEDTLLTTAWSDLPEQAKHTWLWGTGDREITFTWRNGRKRVEYQGKYAGIIPQLVEKFKETKSSPYLKQYEKFMDTLPCPGCAGQRINPQATSVYLSSEHHDFTQPLSLPQVCDLTVASAARFFSGLQLSDTGKLIATEVLKEISARLGFLLGVGLDYLSLARTAPTLSGGESQRIRLASQIGSGLVGVLYILDEPSIGLHPRDNERLIETLLRLRDAGNTLIVVEHDEDTMRAADLVVDFGPGPGVRGGKIVAQGTWEELAANPKSVTGQFLSGTEKIEIPTQRRVVGERWLTVRGARHNNLKNLDVKIPLGALVCVTGVSGSGKSSLVGDILEPALRRALNGAECEPGEFDGFDGIEQLDKMVAIDQSPIGRTPRSNPATYVKVFDEIRSLYANLPEAKKRGFTPGRFSFNVEGGRCSACEGHGSNRLEMDFLADVWVTCQVCEGKRFNRESLEVRFKNHSVADVLELDIGEARDLFSNIPKIYESLNTLHDVGLDYLKLGQPSPTLSGGEAQRIKLSRELSRRATGKTIYILDEPTTGLHFVDIRMLLKVLHDLVDRGNTVIVVEHNLDVIKTADWVIDLGPEGGAAGGEVLFAGRPEELIEQPKSHTGRALRHLLVPRTYSAEDRAKSAKQRSTVEEIRQITVEGASQHNLKGVDVTIPRDVMTVFCGPSGSGKTSLAMDTIYAEGQRRYVESLSAYARQFLGQMQKPRVDRIEGLSPAVALEQRNQGHTPRSTVGTVTEVYDYVRVLMARLGKLHCPRCQIPVGTQTSDQVVDKVFRLDEGTRLLLLAPYAIAPGDDPAQTWQRLRHDGFGRVRINGVTHALDKAPTLDAKSRHRLQIVIDRLIIRQEERSRIADSIEKGLSIGAGVIELAIVHEQLPETDWREVTHSLHLACESCGRSFQPLTPHHFSFNTPIGWCPQCEGLGQQTGTNPAALLRDRNLTLTDGAMLLWPSLNQSVSRWMLRSLSRQTGIPLNLPFDHLLASHRRQLFYGTGARWFDVQPMDTQEASTTESVVDRVAEKNVATPLAEAAEQEVAKLSPDKNAERTLFRFQFKGFYPALEGAARLSPALRSRLEQYVDQIPCTTCDGARLREEAANVRLWGLSIGDLVQMPLGRLLDLVSQWKPVSAEKKIAGELLREIKQRVQFLVDVGLEYLTLGRAAASLSGGESQRIRLAGQLGSGLCGVLYVLDEPTIGLHPRDSGRLLAALHKLRDLGNTLIVVEHDREIIAGSDHLCDFGPHAGRHGGQIVAEGPPSQIASIATSVTGPYLSGTKAISVPLNRRMILTGGELSPPSGKWLTIRGARENNLRGVDVAIPLGTFTAVTGPSGSGKSSLVDDILYPVLAKKLHRANLKPGRHDKLEGADQIDKVIRVDQSPLGNSPTSNPATYCGVFDLVRQLFAQIPEAKAKGFTARQFSFNVPGGRCETCEGSGQRKIEMHFLPDVWVTCEDCQGKRYKPETLEVLFHGRSISEVLDLSIADCLQLFEAHPKICKILQTLADVGLDYVTLGQAAPTLSGGEAQRVKLAAELARPDTGRTLYLLDEPTTGLHFEDIAKLLLVLHRLADLGNTVVVVEHNLDVIKQTDWIIDMGPEAGIAGGMVVAVGTPEMIAEHAQQARKPIRKNAKRSKTAEPVPLLRSYTGEYLGPVLASGPLVQRTVYDINEARKLQIAAAQVALATATGEGTELKAATIWQVLKKKWHMLEKGFPAGVKPKWNLECAGMVLDLLTDIVGVDSVDYSQPRHVTCRAGQKNWAKLFTKREDSLRLILYGAPEAIDLVAIDQLGLETAFTAPDAPIACVSIEMDQLDDSQAEALADAFASHFRQISSDMMTES